MYMRTAAEKRHKDFAKAIRKRRIDRQRDPSPSHVDYYDNLHQYSKNKIHDSNKNKTSMQDRRNIDKINFEENTYFDEDKDDIFL